MRICCCSLAGTKACETCNSNQEYINDYSGLEKLSRPIGVNLFEGNTALTMLRKLKEVTDKLDMAYCDLSNKGEETLNGFEYEKIVDVLIEVEEYLDKFE